MSQTGSSQSQTVYIQLNQITEICRRDVFLKDIGEVTCRDKVRDFEGHSLSVSDVIALKRNGKVSVHYVDSIGFKELPGFLDKKPEHSSVLQMLKEKCDAPECNPTGCRKARAEHEL